MKLKECYLIFVYRYRGLMFHDLKEIGDVSEADSVWKEVWRNTLHSWAGAYAVLFLILLSAPPMCYLALSSAVSRSRYCLQIVPAYAIIGRFLLTCLMRSELKRQLRSIINQKSTK